MKKTIEIKCEGASALPLEDLIHFQGELKDITAKNLTKLEKSILKYGFSFPIQIWKSDEEEFKILDGHQRRLVLQQLKNIGYEIPDIPVNFIEAETEQEAKEKCCF